MNKSYILGRVFGGRLRAYPGHGHVYDVSTCTVRSCLVPSIFQNPDFQIFYNPKSRIQEFPCTCLVAPKIQEIPNHILPHPHVEACMLLLLPAINVAASSMQATGHRFDTQACMQATVNSSQC